MGQRMAARLRAAGHAVVLWNRTPQLAEPLVDQVRGRSVGPRDLRRDGQPLRAVYLSEGTIVIGL